MSADTEHRDDKLALFIIAGMVVLVLGGVVAGVFIRRVVPDKGDVLLGGITTGLILFLRDLVTAVRSSWEEVTRGKISAQLAASGPVADLPKGAAEAAEKVADAANGEAERIAGAAQ